MEGNDTEADESQNSNTLTVSAGDTIPRSTTRSFGDYSRDFEEDDEDYMYITDGDQVGLDMVGDLSIVVWTKTEAITDAGGDKFVMRWDTGKKDFGFIIHNTEKLFFEKNGTVDKSVSGDTVLEDNTEYHCAAVFNTTAGTMTVYLNGVQDGTVGSAGSDIDYNNAGITVGASVDFIANQWGFDGLIDEVGVFDIAIDSTDISDMIDNGLLQVAAAGQIIFVNQ